MQDTVKSTVENMFSLFSRLTAKALPMSESAAKNLSTKYEVPLKALVGRNFLSIDELR
jgi:hypothetical protein